MSGVTSTTGLVSGIDTAGIVDQLMALEGRSVDRIEAKVTTQQAVKTAWMSLSASILGVQSSINGFKDSSSFAAASAATSNESVLTALAGTGATLGTFQFTVKQLAQNHQMVSSGYAARDALVGAGEISFDMGRGRLNRQTELSQLNGQGGVASGKIRITDRAGTSSVIDLTKALTVTDVVDTINRDANLDITASISGDSIVLNDSSGGVGNLVVENVSGGTTATDLGIAGTYASNTVTGSDLVYLSSETPIGSLNDGNGLDRVAGVADMTITLRDGTVVSVNLLGASNSPEDTAWTVGDIIDTLNDAGGGKLHASISADGNSITVVDSSGGAGDLTIADANGSKAASQLGLAGVYSDAAGSDIEVEGGDILAGINTVLLSSLKGGSGLTGGQVMLSDRLGVTTTVDLSGAHTLSEVIEAINGAGVGISASLNDYGTGLVLSDTTGAEDFHMVVSDVTGDLAASLGLEVDADVTTVNGSNADLKYISTSTTLDDLCGDSAWDAGKIKVTTTLGASVEVNLSADNVTTVGDVISNINAMGSSKGITARINDSGTGIVVEDSNGGTVGMKIEEVDGGKTARQLNLLGSVEPGESSIDGSFRTTISLGSSDTLEDLVEKINAAGLDVSASIFSDQSSVNPYRLMLVSERSGRDGELIIDTGATGLSLTTTAKAQDAVVFLGSGDSGTPVVITSDKNELKNVIEGVTLDLKGVDDSPVTISIERDMESVTGTLETFVSTFNSVISSIGTYTRYDSETGEKGVLFANSTVSTVRSKMMNMVLGSMSISSGAYSRLSQVGFSLSSGNKLSFDSEAFMAAFDADPDSVIALFTDAAQTRTTTVDGEEVEEAIAGTGGVGVHFSEIIDSMTDEYDGLITNVTDSIDTKISDLNDRVEYLNTLLDSKRARLENQFAAMELAISQWQAQSSALSSLSSISSASLL